jgi:hypothetical protein
VRLWIYELPLPACACNAVCPAGNLPQSTQQWLAVCPRPNRHCRGEETMRRTHACTPAGTHARRWPRRPCMAARIRKEYVGGWHAAAEGDTRR